MIVGGISKQGVNIVMKGNLGDIKQRCDKGSNNI